MKRLITFITLALIGCGWAGAKVTLPSFFSDNMVLQQNTAAAIWGWTDSGNKVTVSASWTKDKVTVTPGKDGKWFARVQTPSAGGPYEITFSDGTDKTVISNVLIGEVWFCSGQSNMEMIMKGYPGQPTHDAADYIMAAKPEKPLRICTISHKASLSPVEQTNGSWQENTPEVVAETSATAYFFATKLHETLGVPVGILVSCWGGSSIETWIDRETISGKFAGEFDLGFLDGDKLPRGENETPCTLFNGQVHPLIPFSFKGIIWYQGETNRYRPGQYIRLQKEYVAMMRRHFENPDAPFYFAQIAPYCYDAPDDFLMGYFWEAQYKAQQEIPHSGMATTLDVGEYSTIHPCRKKEVGDRLAYLALVNDYGLKGIDPVAPTCESVEFSEGRALVKMKADGMGIAPISKDLEGFELAGPDKVFYPAVGRVVGWSRDIEVRSSQVPDPVAVRYCFRNWSVASVFNNYGIPASPFRTDDWDL